MAKEPEPIELTELPELEWLVQQAQKSNEPLILRRYGHAVAVIMPLEAQRTKKHRPTSVKDPLWSIIGIADYDPDGPTDVSSNKHKYLAEAYADLHEDK